MTKTQMSAGQLTHGHIGQALTVNGRLAGHVHMVRHTADSTGVELLGGPAGWEFIQLKPTEPCTLEGST